MSSNDVVDIMAENDFEEARIIRVGYMLPRLMLWMIVLSNIRFAADNDEVVDDRIRMVEKAIIIG